MYLYVQLLMMIRGRVAFYASARLVPISHILHIFSIDILEYVFLVGQTARSSSFGVVS